MLKNIKLSLVWLFLFSLVIVVLKYLGRVWYCSCEAFILFVANPNSSHNSQHFFDPYTFSHILHGVFFCWCIGFLFPKLLLKYQYFVAFVIEAGWEILENSPPIINRYRSVTAAFGYEGDSVLNSTFDIISCLFGYWLTRKLGFKKSLIFFVLVELALLFWIRDNLTLNVIMLIYPIPGLKEWQLAAG